MSELSNSKKVSRALKLLGFLFLIGYIVYQIIEVHVRAFGSSLVGIKEYSFWSLMGETSIWMGVVGGFLFLFLGLINEIDQLKKLPMIIQVLIGGTAITLTELLSGLLLNNALRLNIWDYLKEMPNDFLAQISQGQINVNTTIKWYLLAPFAFWLDDLARWVFYKTEYNKERKIYSLLSIYKQVFNLKNPKLY
jgi:hypothetical protein